MKKSFHILLACLFTLFLYNCSDDNPSGGEGDEGKLPIPSGTTKTASINLTRTYQEMEGFGASDCWAPNFVGKYWTSAQKEKIARLLFSQEIKNGQPEGIGLSMWRFNLGGGSSEQGDNSNINNKVRRAECFLSENGNYTWTKHAGQQYFIEKAKEYGCEKYVMFSNSPPVFYNYNGKGYSERGEYSNLKEEHYDDFATYMVTVAEWFKTNKNIEFDFISPVNEPQYDWGPSNDDGQEGSGWQNSEISKLARSLNNALQKTSLNTKILLAEAGDWTYLYQKDYSNNRENRSDVIADLFGAGSENYIGNLPGVAPIICGHSYWTDGSWDGMADVRQKVYNKADAYNLKVYQTEWSMLGDNYDSDYPGHDNASFTDIALYMSKVIHQDLTLANVSSWSYWTSMDNERWNHKNRFLLINVIPGDGAYGDMEKSGTSEDTKSLWVLGNYSLFVRPGYKRIALELQDSSKNLFGTAFIAPEGNQVVCVYTNLSGKAINIDAEIKNSGKNMKPVRQYTTSSDKNLKEETFEEELAHIPSNAIVTVIYE
ncbi:MAG: beta-glycosidase [Tannerellaceae bacterium]|nr:beta-glycosidase [Tannerellaceae bacterium]